MRSSGPRRTLAFLILAVALHLALGAVASRAREDSPAQAAMKSGYALWKLGDANRYPEVADWFRRALSYDPQNADYHAALGEALFDCGDAAAGYHELRWSLGFHLRSRVTAARVHLSLGQILESRGKLTEARKEYEKASTLKGSAELTRQARGRHSLTMAKHLKSPHCVVTYLPQYTSEQAAQAASALAEEGAVRALRNSGTHSDGAILIYLLDAEGAGRLGLPADDVREGRGQISTSGEAGPVLARAVTRVVSRHIARRYSDDPLIREGFWEYLEAADPTSLVAQKGASPDLTQMRTTLSDPSSRQLAACFVQFMVQSQGIEAVRDFWSYPNSAAGATEVFGKSLDDLQKDWLTTLAPGTR